MLIASRDGFLTEDARNAKRREEQMYKELFYNTVRRSFDGTTDLNLPQLTSVGNQSFSYCKFRNIVLPNVTSLGYQAFYEATTYGDTIYFPNVTDANRSLDRIHAYGHVSGSVMIVSFPKLLSISAGFAYQGFQRTNNSMRPVIINFDSATSIAGDAFYNSHGVRRLYAPKVTAISGSTTFISWGRQYCGDMRNTPADECAIILGSKELDSGITMDNLMAYSQFPFGAVKSQYSPTWYCKDGTVTYDTSTSAWVQTPYEISVGGGNSLNHWFEAFCADLDEKEAA